MLSHLLSKSGIDNVVVEKRDYETIRTTHRGGIEHGSVNMLVDSGVSDRVLTVGYKHDGIDLRFGGVNTASTSPIWWASPSGCTRRTRCSSTLPVRGPGTAGKFISRSPRPKCWT